MRPKETFLSSEKNKPNTNGYYADDAVSYLQSTFTPQEILCLRNLMLNTLNDGSHVPCLHK